MFESVTSKHWLVKVSKAASFHVNLILNYYSILSLQSLPSVLVSCWRRVLAVMISILWILQNSTTSLHSNWENMQAHSSTFHTMTLDKNEKQVKKKTLPLSLPQSQQNVSGNNKNLSCRGYSGSVPSARSVGDTADAMCPWSVRGTKSIKYFSHH